MTGSGSIGRSSVGRIGLPFNRFVDDMGCEGMEIAALPFAAPFVTSSCDLYAMKIRSPCLESR